MKSSEKAVCGVLTVLLGVLFIALQGDVVSVASSSSARIFCTSA